MNSELDDLLCQRYPLIFAERHLPMDKTSMCWGFTCGDGWFNLIDTLCELLQYETDHNGEPQVVATQVKEKLGKMRFHTRRPITEEQRGMIRMAEAMSTRTCDECGNPGQVVKSEYGHLIRCAAHMPGGEA